MPTDPDPTHTPGGTVTVAGRGFFVQKLTQAEELALWEAMEAAAAARVGPGGLFARHRPTLDYLREHQPAEYDRFVREVAAAHLRANADPRRLLTDDDVEDARRTPEGAAAELFHRTRGAHPEVTLADLRAVVTAANCRQVHRDIKGAVADRGKAPTPSASPAG